MAGYLKTTLLLIALSLAGCAAGPTHDQTLNEQGLNAMQAGNMEEAERLLTQAVQENPNNLQAYINLATLYRNTNRPEQARVLYQRVIDGEATAEGGKEKEEAARLAQMARDNIAQMDQEEAMRQEALRQEEAKRQEEIRRQEAEAAELAAKAAVIAPPVEAVPVPAPVVEESGYRIQTGAFAKPANAEAMRNQLVGRHASLIEGKDVHLIQAGGLTKVQVGFYTTRKEANNACRALRRAGVHCFRITK